jgi:hypothetical protein
VAWCWRAFRGFEREEFPIFLPRGHNFCGNRLRRVAVTAVAFAKFTIGRGFYLGLTEPTPREKLGDRVTIADVGIMLRLAGTRVTRPSGGMKDLHFNLHIGFSTVIRN